jgi:putative FmdB family regulatory protein
MPLSENVKMLRRKRPMPIYDFKCQHCGEVTESLEKMSTTNIDCPHCDCVAIKTEDVYETSFVLKGGGWYADLYSSTNSKTN